MKNLPVLRLTQLLTPEEIKTVQGVHETLEVDFCPIGVCMPGKSRIAHKRNAGGERFSEERYTPRAYYAVSVWKETVKHLASIPEFADALEVEWYPVAATFRSVRYLNDKRDKYIQKFWQIAAEVADRQDIKVRYGRFDSPAPAEYPDYPLRTYVMSEELFEAKLGYDMNDEIDQLPKNETFSYPWHEIKDFFVELSPQQLAFNAGELMNNRGTELDQQFIEACGKHDLPLMKKLFAQGANIHAVDAHGDMAGTSLITDFYEELYFSEKQLTPEEETDLLNKIYQQKIPIFAWLLVQGYDLNICPYAGSTPLYNSVHQPNIDLMKFLLENGADPNIISWINHNPGEGIDVLGHVWNEYVCAPEFDFPMLDEMEKLLKKYGAE